MKVSFSPGDVKSVREFFSQDTSFLDVYVTRELVYLISNRTDMYSHKVFEVISCDDYEGSVGFRVDRKEFLSLLVEGVVSFYVGSSDIVEISFETKGGVRFEMTRPYQASDRTSIMSFFDVLDRQDKFTVIKLSNLRSVIGTVRSFNSIIQVEDGVARVMDDHITMYVKTECENLTLFTSTLSYLLKNGELFFRYQNYIIAKSRDSVVIALQARHGAQIDFEWAIGRGSSHMIRMDVTSATALARRCSAEGLATVNFNTGTVTFMDERVKFSTKLKIHEMINHKDSIKKNKGVSLDDFDFNSLEPKAIGSNRAPVLMFPVKLFKDVLSTLDRSNVRVLVKRDFVLMDIEERVYLCVGRNESAG